MNERAFFISGRELRESKSSDFLWSCYQRFKSLIKLRNSDNLVLVWEDDYKELFDFHAKYKHVIQNKTIGN